MRRWPWLFTCAILGCFGEPDTGGADDDDDTGSGTEAGTTLATTQSTSSGPGGTTAGSGSVEGSGTDPTDGTDGETNTSGSTSSGDPDGSSTGATATTGDDDDDSSSTGAPTTWCDDQLGTVLACYDFDGPGPFVGATVWEEHGTVEVSDEQAVSTPASMRVETTPDTDEPSNASLGRTLVGATLPFAGTISTRLWIDAGCFAGIGAQVERLALALQFFDAADPGGPFFLNVTIWFDSDTTTLYESDAGAGYPSTGHVLGFALASGTWHELALGYDAQGSTVMLGFDGVTQPIELSLATDLVQSEIADIVPAFAVGTTVAANQPGCTMYFDDVIATE